MYKGSCLCGAITFEVDATLPKPDACHCIQCRKWSGHHGASTDVARDALRLKGAENITWFHSSDRVRRGFCKTCGSSLFFDPLDQEKHKWIGVSMGAFDTPTDSSLAVHIFVDEKGDYYDICDGVRQETHPPSDGA